MKKLVLTPRFEGATEAEKSEVLRGLKGLLGGLRCKSVQINCGLYGAFELIGEETHSYPPEPKPAPKELTVTVEGPTGSGKTLVMNAIESLLGRGGVEFRNIATGDIYKEKVVISKGSIEKLRDLGKPRVETIQAMEVKVSAGEAMAAIDKVELALAALSLPGENINAKLRDAANSVLLGLLRDEPKIDATCNAGPILVPGAEV